jgi:hypothetical protein
LTTIDYACFAVIYTGVLLDKYIVNPQAHLLKAKAVNDVDSMSFSSIINAVPNYYLVILLNSELLFDYYREYINCTVNFQINDIRQLPILMPTNEQLNTCKPSV